MSPEPVVEIVALVIALWAAGRSVPRPPELDWERFFKVSLATVIRGELERAGGDLAAWEKATLGRVLYHPAAGERPETRLSDPANSPVPVPARPGERALIEALTRLPDPAARFRWMYVDDYAAAQGLFLHPEELGAAYDPSGALAPGLDWDAVAAWTEPVQAALARRLGHVVMVDLGGDWATRLADAIPGLRRKTFDPGLAHDALVTALLDALEQGSDRLALFTQGPGALHLLKALAGSPALIDKTAAVISVAGELGGDADARAWLDEHFNHESFEPELHRAIPYVSVLRASPDGEGPLPWAAQRFPTPPPVESGRDAIQPIDLGPLVLDELDPSHVSRALGLLLARHLSG